MPDSLPKINWDHYASRISIPGLVADFQKQYENLNIPYPEDKYTAQILEVEKEAVSQLVV